VKSEEAKMYIETQRLILRNFTLDDLYALHEILGDEIVMQNCAGPESLEENRNTIENLGIKKNGCFACVTKDTNKLIGYVLFKAGDEDEIREAGWIFHKDYWRAGYAYEICSKLFQYAFEEMSVHKIVAHATDDVKSVALMEKLGMKREGILRKHSKSHLSPGIWLDLFCYGLLKEEFAE